MQVFVQNDVFRNNFRKSEHSHKILQARHRVTRDAPMQTFGVLRQSGAKRRIFQTFLSRKQCIVSPTSRWTIYRQTWTQNVNRCHHENFRNRISKFFWRIWALHLIVEGPGKFAPASIHARYIHYKKFADKQTNKEFADKKKQRKKQRNSK